MSKGYTQVASVRTIQKAKHAPETNDLKANVLDMLDKAKARPKQFYSQTQLFAYCLITVIKEASRMKKLSTLAFSLVTMGFIVFALVSPNYILQNLIEVSQPFIHARILMVLVLVSYVFVSEIRTRGMRLLMFMGGLTMVALGISTLFSPMLFGYLSSYVPIGDTVIFLEGGILMLLAAAELSIRQPAPKLQPTHPRFATPLHIAQGTKLVRV